MLFRRLTAKDLKRAAINFLTTYVVMIAALFFCAVVWRGSVSRDLVIVLPCVYGGMAAFATVYGNKTSYKG